MTRREPAASDVRDLEQVLRAQLEDYRELLDCLQTKRAAIRSADLEAVDTATQRERRILVRCGQREPRRRALLQRLGPAADDADAPTVRAVAERLDDPARTRLEAAAAELREVATTVRCESSIVRQAAETLSQHLAGIMQTMQSALGRAPLYGQRGRLDGGPPVQFTVDVKS